MVQNTNHIMESEMSYGRFDSTATLTENDLPVRAEYRRRTDMPFLGFLILCILVLTGLVVYSTCFIDTDAESPRSQPIHRIENDYIFDYDADYNDDYNHDQNYNRPNEWINNDGGQEIITAYLAGRLLMTTCVALGLSIFLAIMLRYATKVFVWSILIISWLIFVALTVLFWIYVNISAGITFTIVTLCLLCVLLFMKDKIRLVVMLYTEATKAVFDMKPLFVFPIVTVCILLVGVSLFGYTTVLMAAKRSEDVIIVTFVLNSIISYWVAEFFIGIQYMIVSGAIVKWYFTRNKANLGRPVYTSMVLTLKYHVGSVAFGSLIITLITALRMVLRSLAYNNRTRWLINCCMSYIESFLRFFTKNSYIVTAMHGTSFIESGKTVVKLLTVNVCNTIALTSIGDFVIAMSYILVIFFTVMVNTFLITDIVDTYQDIYIYNAVMGVVALVCGFTILGTFENSFSTIFLCTCQDFEINNGTNKPYAMTRNIMEYLNESKIVFASTIQKKNISTI